MINVLLCRDEGIYFCRTSRFCVAGDLNFERDGLKKYDVLTGAVKIVYALQPLVHI